jgi:peptidoglycan/xylan/chitin deacetylase (PgdA/CDA1 family)
MRESDLVLGRLLRPATVLAYHGVARADDSVDPDRLLLDPSLLADQLAVLRRRRYRFLTAEQLLDEPGGQPRPGTAVLTFDDGWVDAITDVVPLLERLGIAATFYVCPGWLGGHHPKVSGPSGRLLDRDQLVALERGGMEVASHSMLHRDLRTLTDDDLVEDLTASKAMIEAVTERACRTFAYPYGFSDERVERAVDEAGYELAFAWAPGPWRPMAAPRLPAPPRHGGRRLALKLLGVRRRAT